MGEVWKAERSIWLRGLPRGMVLPPGIPAVAVPTLTSNLAQPCTLQVDAGTAEVRQGGRGKLTSGQWVEPPV